jgi:cytochrome bd ubiquinol oxidase subunit II
MADLWYGVLALTLIAYTVLDGFDFGAGILHLFVAKTDGERRAVFSAVGPYFHANEVWLISAGGVLFLAFPKLLATAFPAFYLALFLVLWCLMGRGISIEVRSHIRDPMWAQFWDVVFAVSSLLLALLFGVALGNVVRGVPIDGTGEFTMALFTHFGTTGITGLLDYYTLSVGLFALTLLTAHGAAFLAWRCEGEPRARAAAAERWLWPASFALLVAVTIETWFVRPDLFTGMQQRPLSWLAVAVAIAGVYLVLSGRKQDRDLRVFAGSSAVIGGMLASVAVGLFPTLLHSTLRSDYDLRVSTHATARQGLAAALVWWPVAFALAVSYFVFIFRTQSHKISNDDASH